MLGFKLNGDSGHKVMPHCLQSEYAILGSVMIDEGVLGKLTISSKHFFARANKKVFSSMLSLLKKGVGIDLVTLSDDLKKKDLLEEVGGIVFISSLLTVVPSAISWKNYENIIIDKYNRRVLIDKFTHSADSLYNENTDVFKIKESIDDEKIESTKFGLDNEDMLNALCEKADRVAEGDTPLFKTGIKPIDDELGGFGQGSLITIGAPSSGGKSAFAAQLINKMSKKAPVLYFSMEMTVEQIAERWIAQETNYANKYLQSQAYLDEVNVTGEFAEFLGKRTIKFDRSSEYEYILQSIKHHIYQSDVKLIVIDYLQMIRFRGNDLAYEPKNISSVMNGLKDIALDNNVCIVMLSQLNDKLEYFGASVIRNASDTCFKILPPYTDEDDGRGGTKRVLDEKSSIRSVNVDKHRSGEKFHQFIMDFHGDSQTFKEYIEDPDDDGFIEDLTN